MQCTDQLIHEAEDADIEAGEWSGPGLNRPTLRDTIHRLRETKIEGDAALRKSGLAAGRRWAAAAATAVELTILESAFGGRKRQRELTHTNVYMQLHSDMIEPEDHDVQVWWEEVAAVAAYQIVFPAFVRGFVDGASALWLEVRSDVV